MNLALDLQHIDLRYGDRPVLNDVSFYVEEGEFFIIIGPNGSGKTTLVKTISGAAKPQSGEVKVLARMLRGCSAKTLARNIAVVPQTIPGDISFTVAEVVLMGRSLHLGLLGIERKEDMEITEQAMAFTNVEHLAHRRFDQLSAGERQRTLIARAVCQQTPIIVLDEPTASLDPAHQIHIMDLMEKLRCERGITVIMVSHDLNLAAMYANRLLLMKQGNVASLGSPAEVLTAEILIPTYGCAMQVDENPLMKVPRVTLLPNKLFSMGTIRQSTPPGTL